MNGASVATLRAASPKVQIDADQLQMLDRSAKALTVFSMGTTLVQALALKVAKGEMSVDAAANQLKLIG